MRSGAAISECGTYRYVLWRYWDEALLPLVWIMLNPSTADGKVDDPTIVRVMNFTRAWGYGGCRVINLYALRATDPKELRRAADPVGPENETFWDADLRTLGECVCAWGANPMAKKIEEESMDWLLWHEIKLYCVTKDVAKPNHPLYLPNGLPMISMDGYEPKRAK